MTTISFKSIPEYWHKEFIGKKRSTIRKRDLMTDERFSILDQWIKKPFYLEIQIINTENTARFTRVVIDVTLFCQFYIISW
jgi:hypothetical protein